MAFNKTTKEQNKFWGENVKIWLSIVITIGGLISSYFIFKTQTQDQLSLLRTEVRVLRTQIHSLKSDFEQNKREWQEQIEQQIQILRENDIKQDLILKVLTNRPLE